jgi:hypothetical protein
MLIVMERHLGICYPLIFEEACRQLKRIWALIVLIWGVSVMEVGMCHLKI